MFGFVSRFFGAVFPMGLKMLKVWLLIVMTGFEQSCSQECLVRQIR